MEIIYKAFDGKVFNDEEKCLNYETENLIKNNHLIFLDEDGNRLNINDVFEALINAEFISITTKNAFEIIKRVGEKYGLTFPPMHGFWKWDENHDGWVSIDDKMEEIVKTLHFYHLLRLKTLNNKEE